MHLTDYYCFYIDFVVMILILMMLNLFSLLPSIIRIILHVNLIDLSTLLFESISMTEESFAMEVPLSFGLVFLRIHCFPQRRGHTTAPGKFGARGAR